MKLKTQISLQNVTHFYQISSFRKNFFKLNNLSLKKLRAETQVNTNQFSKEIKRKCKGLLNKRLKIKYIFHFPTYSLVELPDCEFEKVTQGLERHHHD